MALHVESGHVRDDHRDLARERAARVRLGADGAHVEGVVLSHPSGREKVDLRNHRRVRLRDRVDGAEVKPAGIEHLVRRHRAARAGGATGTRGAAGPGAPPATRATGVPARLVVPPDPVAPPCPLVPPELVLPCPSTAALPGAPPDLRLPPFAGTAGSRHITPRQIPPVPALPPVPREPPEPVVASERARSSTGRGARRDRSAGPEPHRPAFRSKAPPEPIAPRAVRRRPHPPLPSFARPGRQAPERRVKSAAIGDPASG